MSNKVYILWVPDAEPAKPFEAEEGFYRDWKFFFRTPNCLSSMVYKAFNARHISGERHPSLRNRARLEEFAREHGFEAPDGPFTNSVEYLMPRLVLG